MSKEFGSKADMLSSKLNEVARNRIWHEHCTKEQNTMQLNTHFAINNPYKMNVITNKPNYMVPNIKTSSSEFEEATATLKQVCDRKIMLDEQEELDLPMTSSQEIGFNHKPLVQRENVFHFSRTACEITKYADAYYDMAGTTPFSRKVEAPPK